MTYKLKKLLLILLLSILIISSLYVIFYYLFARDIAQIENLPTLFFAVVIVYIFGQLIKRFLQAKNPWYSWLYYVGLVAIVSPAFVHLGNWIPWVARIGSLFLLFPPLFELISLLKPTKTEK